MQSKWFSILVALFIIYAFVNKAGLLPNQSTKTPMAQAPAEDKDSGIIDTIKSYATLLTSTPQGQSFEEKSVPIIKEDNYTPHVESKRPVTSNEAMQDKIANVIYNILHTKQGQELMEKFLYAPRAEMQDSKPTSDTSPYNNNSILNIIEGEGEPAECGDIVTVHYTTRLMSGQIIEDTHLNKPKSFQLGDQKVIKGLEYAVIGMQKGGMRRLITVPRLAYVDPKFSKDLVGRNEFITIDVELLDITFALDDWKNKIKIFQKLDENNGQIMLCSNEIYFNYKLSNAHERVISQSKTPVHFTLGSTQVPAAINRAFSGIKSRSKRVVMIPSSLIYKKKISFLPDAVKLSPKEMLIFEINTNTGNLK